MKRSLWALSCVLAWVLIAPADVSGQADMATVVGTVVDSSGGVVPNCAVTLIQTGTGAKTSVTTDTQGSYIATPLRIGNYSVTVEAHGFKTETRTGIVLQVQDRLRVDFTLQIGSVNETVTVEAAAPW